MTISSRRAKAELATWERELEQSLKRQGRMTSDAASRGSGRKRSATDQAVELMSKGIGVAKKFAGSLLNADTSFEQLVRALASASDGTETLDQQIKELAKTGSLPGLNFEIAVRGALKLQTLGYSAEESRVFIEQLGNEIARTGGTTENMDGFLVQMMQTLSKGKVEMQDFKIMAEHLTGFMKLSEGLDRSSAGEFFGGLLGRLKEGPRVVAGNTEAFKNLMDQWNRFQSETSGGKVAGVAASFADAATNAMKGKDWFGDGGIIDNLGSGIKDSIMGQGKKANPIKRFQPTDEELAARKKVESDRAKMEKARIEDALKMERAKAEEIQSLEFQIDEAKDKGDKDKLAALEDQLEILKEAKKVADELGVSEKQAADLIKEINRTARQYEQSRENAANKKELSGDAAQMEQDRLRASGKDRRADKLAKQQFLKDETDRLTKKGLSPEDARAMAEKKQQIKEDADYFAKHGKAKIHGATDGGGSRAIGTDEFRKRHSDGGMQSQSGGIDGAKKGGFNFREFFDTGIPGFAENYGPDSNKKQQAAQKRAAAAQKAADGPSIVEEVKSYLKSTIGPSLDRIVQALQKPKAA